MQSNNWLHSECDVPLWSLNLEALTFSCKALCLVILKMRPCRMDWNGGKMWKAQKIKFKRIFVVSLLFPLYVWHHIFRWSLLLFEKEWYKETAKDSSRIRLFTVNLIPSFTAFRFLKTVSSSKHSAHIQYMVMLRAFFSMKISCDTIPFTTMCKCIYSRYIF